MTVGYYVLVIAVCDNQPFIYLSIPETDFVFFSAVATSIEAYEPGDIIKFHDTIVNVNPGFPGWNPATNMFKCPYDGYYLFIVTLHKAAPAEYNHFARLRSTATSVITELRGYQDNVSGSYSRSSSTMHAIVACEQGEQVWVEMYLYTASTYGYRFDQFSGLLIKQGLE